MDLVANESEDVSKILSRIKEMSANSSQWEERFASGKAAICLVNAFVAKSENQEVLNKYIQELFNDKVVLKVSRDEEYRVRLLGKEMHLQGISSHFLNKLLLQIETGFKESAEASLLTERVAKFRETAKVERFIETDLHLLRAILNASPHS